MHHIIPLIPSLQEFVSNPILARGGGGGSGGGGGGGGGGSGGSGGGGIALIGYLPAHYGTSYLNRRISRLAGLVGGTLIAILVSGIAFWAAGGVGFIIAIGAAIGVYSGMHNLVGRLVNKVARTRKLVKFAESKDPVWQEVRLTERIIELFYKFQLDWSTFNLDSMRGYTAPRFFDHQRLLLAALYQMGRQNAVASPTLTSSQIVDMLDSVNNDSDSFTALIEARADDTLIDSRQKTVIYTDKSSFTEIWHFDRQGDQWIIDDIRQATEDASMLSAPLHTFASQNGMHYSPDMGWLLLPQRGQLFGKANFKKSDVNNHVIGEWNGLIVQLYTYVPFRLSARADNYLVGQINLPKSYGGIIVKRRKSVELFARPPRGYQAVSFEWPDFNKRYHVYATDIDQVTSFELLNPQFMANLYDKDLPISIEVVDNTVYFYCLVSVSPKSYVEMLAVLQAAHKELKR